MSDHHDCSYHTWLVCQI